jgi:aminopeptidase N
LGLEQDGKTYFYDCLHAHEVAHQWWGNKVGWKTYHDVWMIEGFSTYLGYLSLLSKYPDGRQFQEAMRLSKQKLQSEEKDHQVAENAGPVWLGIRLQSSKFPDGYMTVVYEKGAWIFHMLRYLFQDPATASELGFQGFAKDLMATFDGKLISTADLQKAAERHMTKSMDLEGNRKLDWFFEEWVYETGIPTYRLSYSVAPLKEGKVVVKGKILQENVSETFTMPVEVFAHFPAEKVVKIGRVDVSGKETSFRFTLGSKPLKVSLDDNHQILCTNKTF